MFESYFSELIKIFNLTVGFCLLIAAFIIGIGFGFGWALFGGLTQLFATFKMNPFEISALIISLIRISFSYFIGYLTGAIFFKTAMKIFDHYSVKP